MKHLFSIIFAAFLVSVTGCQHSEPPLDFRKDITGVEVEHAVTDGPPDIVVTGRYMFPRIVSGTENPLVIINLPPAKTMQFCWSVVNPNEGDMYRFGWDIRDLNDDMDWETPFMPFASYEACSTPHSFFFGTHTFHVEVIDGGGQKTRASIKINLDPMGQSAILDIRPYTRPNFLFTHAQGIIQMVLLGTETMDVNMISLETIRLGSAVPVRTTIRDIGSPSPDGGECASSDKMKDGRDDLIMTFRIPDIVPPSQPKWPFRINNRMEVVLFLWGDMIEPAGARFVASDCVWIPGPKRGPHASPDNAGITIMD